MIRTLARFVLATLFVSSLLVSSPFLSTMIAADPPRLVVVVSVDQLAYEYFDRLRDNFAADGFFAKARGGGAAWYTNCLHRHALTFTAPGHAVMLTGAYPNHNGIIDNSWHIRTALPPANPMTPAKKMYCVEDAEHPIVGPAARFPVSVVAAALAPKGISPKNLLVPTVGDVLKQTTNGKAKVFGVTIKDRSAVLMAGHKADHAIWYDEQQGYWVSSTYYGPTLPAYVQELNERDELKKYAEQTWELLLPRDRYRSRRPDDYQYEGSPTVATEPKGLGKTFPHQLAPATKSLLYQQIPITPFGNEMVLDLAKRIVEHERLGADDVTDLLCVGLSSNDYVGHQFDPQSLEAEDMCYRTDRQLADWLKQLDQRVGPGRWTLVLTADHGISPLPEYAKEIGLDGKRLGMPEQKEIVESIEKSLDQKFGELPETQTWVQAFGEGLLFLRSPTDSNGPEMRRLTAEALRRSPYVAAAFTREELLEAPPTSDELLDRFRRSFHPDRAGDVLYALKPYHQLGRLPTTHGSPWKYDSHVPCVLLGAGIRPGEYERSVGPAAIAPTLARLLGINPPSGNEEQELSEAIR